ncbi:MAG TPA: type II secretion system protein [Candidatus Omnitrophota bacterium]|nr:type II secretion system protein [Candidatus Omnitrophota bacterium]HQJ15077.1 type II secretion system protein [Candidatus Omnitrophota bacterium]
MSRKGFTLIELVMVIVIIGILAAVAIPKFIDLKHEADRAVCQSNVGAIRTALSNFYAKYQVNSTGATAGGIDVNTTSGFPLNDELNYSANATDFAEEYFADGKLPDNASTTSNPKVNWGDPTVYDPGTGVINMSVCCP